ncbi:hypothetical protein EMCRGX_G008597 [Ephydatia muelleri]|eukprot:Em0002g39a
MAEYGAQQTTAGELDTSHAVFAGQDLERIPEEAWRKYGPTAKTLDLSYNLLKTLDGIQNFSALEELVLDNNELDDSSLELPLLAHLRTLTLNKNQITDTERILTTLKEKCPHLHYLSLLGNQACPNELLGTGHDDEDYQRYRYYVIFKMPNLAFLDSKPVTAQERKEAKRVGEFMKIVRPSAEVFQASEKKPKASDSEYTPLPQSQASQGQHKGVFGKCKYVYYGKHSEGNRFIRNNQL